VSARIDEAKRAIRRRVWDLLEQERVVERGVHGYVPAFAGAAAAADRLASLPEWQAAQVVKAVPDRAHRPAPDTMARAILDPHNSAPPWWRSGAREAGRKQMTKGSGTNSGPLA